VDPDVLQARQDARLIRNVTLAQLLATATTANIDATTRATLEALFRQRPAEIAGAMTFAHKSDRAAAKLVLEALGAAGTPAAQETLCGLAADINASAETRVDAIAALVQPKRPTPSTISQLIRLLDASEPTVSKQALYVLGAAGSRSQEVDATIAPRIEAELLRRQQHCQGDACADLLVAMGNLATPALVPAIERSLHDPNAGIRASAARALRKVQDPSADRMIADAMRDDRDPSVRSAAVLAATFRPIGPLLEPLTHLVEADPVEYVRTNAIEAVASHVGESPLVQHALLAAANSDRSPGVRRLARKILGSRLAAQNVQSGQP
jgi:HEAT repeat protein